MDPNFDNENYWNRSIGKAFSFDDDDDDESIKALRNLNINDINPQKQEILSEDSLSEASFDNSASALDPNLTIESFITKEALQMILEEQIMEDHFIPKDLSLEDEVKLLRRQVQNTLYSPSSEQTVRKLQMGKIVSLEVYKSLQDKEELLDACLRNGCAGAGIISVLLFLEKTLNKDIFYKILSTRPIALDHYLSFLKQTQSPEAVDVLIAMGKFHEALMLQYSNAFNVTDLTERRKLLARLLKDSSDKHMNGVCQEMIRSTLQLMDLREQLNVNDELSVNATSIEILYASCSKTTNWKDKQASCSPFQVAANLQISPGQFEWTVLHERARSKAYIDLEQIFEGTPPQWLPLKQKQFQMSIPLDLVISRLHKLDAPSSVLYLFLSRMPNTKEKLELAEKVKCPKAVIDTLVELKDVGQLLKLHDTLPERSEEQFYCENALKKLQNKRWMVGAATSS